MFTCRILRISIPRLLSYLSLQLSSSSFRTQGDVHRARQHGHGHHDHRGHHGNHGSHGIHNEEHPYQNKPHSHVAYHHVEQACAKDVENFCTAPTEQHPLLMPMDWAFPSDRELMDIAQTMDRMMESFFSMPSPDHHFGTITIYTPEMIHQSPKRATVHDLNFVADSTASQLASQTKPEEIPQLAKKLNSYGEHLMASSQEGRPDHHIGRRLTEMDAETLGTHVRLPFGCHKNACLMKMRNRVSPECARSLKELESISYLEDRLEEHQATQMMYMLVYFALLITFLALVVKKARMGQKKALFGHKILEVIYANPKLKRQVELEMGQSVGEHAPVPHMGRKIKEQFAEMQRTRFLFLLAIVYAFVAAPFMILPLCILAMFFRVLYMCVIVHQKDGDEEEESDEEVDELKKPLMKEQYTPPSVGEGEKHTFESKKEVHNGIEVTIV